ncbi:unnamed protein product [Rhizophagus irregularis]|nr:unnamed protein product [Rhizophagus irregularis]
MFRTFILSLAALGPSDFGAGDGDGVDDGADAGDDDGDGAGAGDDGGSGAGVGPSGVGGQNYPEVILALPSSPLIKIRKITII